MTADEARSKIAAKEFDTLVDTRSNKEYNLGHLSGAIHLQSEDVSSVLTDKAGRILVYGDTASATADTLYGMGYKNVHYISGTYMSLR